ncbi:acyl-CoA-binding protein [Oscillatoria salina]|uniref:acyl-CoA-binding protein n=1 Tax=Oscillatoria salina TaxID=331517 RepID=UPI001CCDE0A2|nr:acyl-CoA-binding protein [Oscillatoria salina]MBZ8183324.1 hypothetical protein [Oscillatoria salina IIICB1]
MLSPAEIEQFQQKGWVGPLTIFSPERIAAVKHCLETHSRLIVEANGQEILGFYNNVMNMDTPRDQHLFHRSLADLFKDCRLVKQLNQIAGPDLLLWYTNVFCKLPGQGEIKWHQAIEYYTSSDIDYQKKTLVYAPDEAPINLTVWVALEDADLENGCLRFANGSHRKTFPIIPGARPAQEGVFAGISAHKTVWQREQKYSLAYDFDEQDWELEAVPVKAGQAVIFTEKVMHSSLPNRSNRRRLAIIGRYVRPSTQVYPYRRQGDFIDENGHNIARHYCILVSGEDRYGHNVVRDWHNLDPIEVEFQQMSNRVRFGQVEIPEDKRQLEIYGLEKQAIQGDCTEAEPNPMLHPRQYIQWQAWNQYRGLSKTEAMGRYSQLVVKLPAKAVPSEGLKSGQGKFSRRTATDIQAWLLAYLGELLELSTDEIDPASSFQSYGLSSAEGVGLIRDLSDWLGETLTPPLLFDYPTVAALSAHLAAKAPIANKE